jgi:hypothetical protein
MLRIATLLVVLAPLAPDVAAAQPVSIVRLRWVLTSVDEGDPPRTRVVLEVEGAARGTIDVGTVEGGCEEEDVAELRNATPRGLRPPRGVRTLAALRCYYGGYGWYVRAELRGRTLSVRRFGMAEPHPDNERPPAERVESFGRVAVPAGVEFRVIGPSNAAAYQASAPACGRALRCCTAYVEAVGAGVTTAQACAAIESAIGVPNGDTACEQMVLAWRQSLETMRHPVPEACR